MKDTLVHRTNTDWSCLCQCRVWKQSDFALLYLDRDKETLILCHQPPIFLDETGCMLQEYVHGSIVLDRLAAISSCFLLKKKIEIPNPKQQLLRLDASLALHENINCHLTINFVFRSFFIIEILTKTTWRGNVYK